MRRSSEGRERKTHDESPDFGSQFLEEVLSARKDLKRDTGIDRSQTNADLCVGENVDESRRKNASVSRLG